MGKELVLVTYEKFRGFGLKVSPELVPTLNRIGMLVETPLALTVTVALLFPVGNPEANRFMVTLCDPVRGPLDGWKVIQVTLEVGLQLISDCTTAGTAHLMIGYVYTFHRTDQTLCLKMYCARRKSRH